MTRARKNLLLLLGSLAVATAAFIVPERLVVSYFTAESSQVGTIDSELRHSQGKDILLIGDSTVRCMQPNQGGFDPDPRIVNLGAGGVRANVWRYILLKALRRGEKFRAVVFAMSGGGTSLLSADRYSSFYPFLMEWKDVFAAAKSGQFSYSNLPAVVFSMLAPLSVTNEEALFMMANRVSPSLGQYLATSALAIKKEGWYWDAREEERDLKAILSTLREANLGAIFVNSPSSSNVWKTDMAREGRERLLALCHKHQLQCKDLSAALPDDYFGFDGVHLIPQRHDVFRDLIKKAVDE